MDQTINFGMNNCQNANNNINQINNSNRFNNLMLNQYNQNNSMMNQMMNINQDNPLLNQMNTFNTNNSMMNQMINNNQVNPLLNQMNTFNPNNPMLNQMTNINNDNPLLNQMNTFNQNNPMLNQITNINEGNQILNQMNTMINQMTIILNQMNTMLNQMNSHDQNKPMINMDINLINLKMIEINEKMKQINEKMKKINEINQEERKKETIQNINLNNLNKNQMELINSIIKFYKENGNGYMNFDYPYQIKNMIYFLSLNYHKLDISDNIEDPLYYIEEPKKMIKFINSNYKEYEVKIPLSITKYDLYSIAQKYKCFQNNKKHYTGDKSNILLINKYLILNRDETSIECIGDNDIIIIIEPRNFPDDSYYKSLQERTEEKRLIGFKFSSGLRIYRIFPDDIKIYEIYKSYNLEFGLDIYTYKLLFCGLPLKISDQKEGSFLFKGIIMIHEFKIFKKNTFGKIVTAIILNNIKGGELVSIGILNSIKDLIAEVQMRIDLKKLKKFTIENKIIEKGDTMSLFSLGIESDFNCFAEFED